MHMRWVGLLLVAHAWAQSPTKIYAGSKDGKLWAFTSTGSVAWQSEDTGAEIKSASRVSPDGSEVYVGTKGDSVWAFYTSDGSTKWEASTSGEVKCRPVLSPTGGSLYVAGKDKKVWGFRVSDGAKLWESDAIDNEFESDPVLSPDGTVLYIGSHSKKVHAVNTADGTFGWTSNVGEVVKGPIRLNSAGTVLYLRLKRSVFAISASTGSTLWVSPFSDGDITGGPLLSRDESTIYVGTNGNILHAFRSSGGAELWSANLGSEIQSEPIESGSVLYVASKDKIHKLATSDGSVIWSQSAPEEAQGYLGIAGGLVFASCKKKVCAYHLDSGVLAWESSAAGGDFKYGLALAETQTSSPTPLPSTAPTGAPTASPTRAPSTTPTKAPTAAPTKAPTSAPTIAPTLVPTATPTAAPTKAPTNTPTATPTQAPSSSHTTAPTAVPTSASTTAPTGSPTKAPTTSPTKAPTTAPTVSPTKTPTTNPATTPSIVPSTAPSVAPTRTQTGSPTSDPSGSTTGVPSTAPTQIPTFAPTVLSSTAAPSLEPTTTPLSTKTPTSHPTREPGYKMTISGQILFRGLRGADLQAQPRNVVMALANYLPCPASQVANVSVLSSTARRQAFTRVGYQLTGVAATMAGPFQDKLSKDQMVYDGLFASELESCMQRAGFVTSGISVLAANTVANFECDGLVIPCDVPAADTWWKAPQFLIVAAGVFLLSCCVGWLLWRSRDRKSTKVLPELQTGPNDLAKQRHSSDEDMDVATEPQLPQRVPHLQLNRLDEPKQKQIKRSRRASLGIRTTDSLLDDSETKPHPFAPEPTPVVPTIGQILKQPGTDAAPAKTWFKGSEGVDLSRPQLRVAKNMFAVLSGHTSEVSAHIAIQVLPGMGVRAAAFQSAVENQFHNSPQQQKSLRLTYGSEKRVNKAKQSYLRAAKTKDEQIRVWLDGLLSLGDGKLTEEMLVSLCSRIRDNYGNRGLLTYVQAVEETTGIKQPLE